jgi:hypothetical protein
MKLIASRVLTIMIAWLIVSTPPVCFGANDKTLRTQGLINPGGNLKAGYLLINEMRIYIDRSTQVMDANGVAIPVSELKQKRWVFMEIEKDSAQMSARAKKIYLLPRYIKPEEKQKFSFMK